MTQFGPGILPNAEQICYVLCHGCRGQTDTKVIIISNTRYPTPLIQVELVQRSYIQTHGQPELRYCICQLITITAGSCMLISYFQVNVSIESETLIQELHKLENILSKDAQQVKIQVLHWTSCTRVAQTRKYSVQRCSTGKNTSDAQEMHKLHKLHKLHNLQSLEKLQKLQKLHKLQKLQKLQKLHKMHKLHKLHKSCTNLKIFCPKMLSR